MKLIVNSNVESNFPHKILLADTQVSKILNAFASSSSANIKFSKTELFKMIKSEACLTDITGLVNFFKFSI